MTDFECSNCSHDVCYWDVCEKCGYDNDDRTRDKKMFEEVID